MAIRRGRAWAIVVLLVVVLGAAAAAVVWRWPMLLPGTHTVSVYAVDDGVSGAAVKEPGLLSRLLGFCDADTYYVADGRTRLCLVLNGPLGEVRASRHGGRITVHAADVPTLRTIAHQDTASPVTTTRLALVAHRRPVAIIPVAGLAGTGPIDGNALD